MALRAAESNEDAALRAMSHASGSQTGSTETMSEAIGVYGTSTGPRLQRSDLGLQFCDEKKLAFRHAGFLKHFQ